jgi:hypothetical protein
VSCNTTSILELERRIPVNPPKVKRKINPFTHRRATDDSVFLEPYNLANQLKILTPVGTAIVIVAAVKYARVSTSIPTVNM